MILVAQVRPHLSSFASIPGRDGLFVVTAITFLHFCLHKFLVNGEKIVKSIHSHGVDSAEFQHLS